MARPPPSSMGGADPVLPIGVFVSGEGTTLEGLAEEIAEGRLRARIAVVVADRDGIGAIDRAKRLSLPLERVIRRGAEAADWAGELDRAVRSHGVEIVVLAGFLSILPDGFLDRWAGRVINVHPALLPKFGGRGFYGEKVHEAVLASGATETGATVHMVTSEVDGGPILAQRSIPIDRSETPARLRERLRPIERALLVEALNAFSDGSRPLPYGGVSAGAATASGGSAVATPRSASRVGR